MIQELEGFFEDAEQSLQATSYKIIDSEEENEDQEDVDLHQIPFRQCPTDNTQQPLLKNKNIVSKVLNERIAAKNKNELLLKEIRKVQSECVALESLIRKAVIKEAELIVKRRKKHSKLPAQIQSEGLINEQKTFKVNLSSNSLTKETLQIRKTLPKKGGYR